MNDRIVPGRDQVLGWVPGRRNVFVRPMKDEERACRRSEQLPVRVGSGYMSEYADMVFIGAFRDFNGYVACRGPTLIVGDERGERVVPPSGRSSLS